MRRPEPVTDLAWSPQRARDFADRVQALWLEHLEVQPQLPVFREEPLGALREAVRREVPDAPLDDDELVAYLRTLVLEHGTQTGHGGFMAYISGAGTVPGAPASLLAAGINQNLGGHVLGPAATELETHLLRWFAARLGLPATADGAFVSGGATANLMAMTVARDHLAGWDVRREGVAAGPPLAIYASDDVHDTIDRAADLLGLGSAAVRRVALDERMRVRPDALAAAIESDVAAGVRPIAVVGSAGTTETGAIDPLDELADVAAAHGCWFHVDAAYGGPAAMVGSLRGRFAGIERADSITCDPHKWMGTPISSSFLLVRDPDALVEAFTLSPDYTRQAPSVEPADVPVFRYQWTPQFTRPFDALPVWTSLLAHGWDAVQRRIAHDVELARWLHHLVTEHPALEAALEPDLSVVCFRYVPPALAGRVGEEATDRYLDELTDRVMFALQRSGRVLPSNAVVHGRNMVRACLISYRTEAEDVEALVELTVALGRDLDAELRPEALAS